MAMTLASGAEIPVEQCSEVNIDCGTRQGTYAASPLQMAVNLPLRKDSTTSRKAETSQAPERADAMQASTSRASAPKKQERQAGKVEQTPGRQIS